MVLLYVTFCFVLAMEMDLWLVQKTERLIFCFAGGRAHDDLEVVLLLDSSHLPIAGHCTLTLGHKIVRLVLGIVVMGVAFEPKSKL